MKTLRFAIGAAVGAGALAALTAPAFAQDPYPAAKVAVPVYADTVSSSRGDVKLARVCTQTNLFPRRARVVFRSWATDSATGKALTALEIRYAYVKIPGQPNIKLNWGSHGAVGNKVWFWTAAFDIPADYPLGVMAYRIVFKTETGKFGIFDPSTLPEASRLTINP